MYSSKVWNPAWFRLKIGWQKRSPAPVLFRVISWEIVRSCLQADRPWSACGFSLYTRPPFLKTLAPSPNLTRTSATQAPRKPVRGSPERKVGETIKPPRASLCEWGRAQLVRCQEPKAPSSWYWTTRQNKLEWRNTLNLHVPPSPSYLNPNPLEKIQTKNKPAPAASSSKKECYFPFFKKKRNSFFLFPWLSSRSLSVSSEASVTIPRSGSRGAPHVPGSDSLQMILKSSIQHLPAVKAGAPHVRNPPGGWSAECQSAPPFSHRELESRGQQEGWELGKKKRKWGGASQWVLINQSRVSRVPLGSSAHDPLLASTGGEDRGGAERGRL